VGCSWSVRQYCQHKNAEETTIMPQKYKAGSTSSGEEDEEKESGRVMALAGLTLIAGLVLLLVSLEAIHSKALFEVDRLVRYNAEYGPGDNALVITTRTLFKILVGVGFLVLFSAITGLIGAKQRNKGMVCTYVVTGAVLAMVMLTCATMALNRRSMIEPVVTKQVSELCEPATYIRLAVNMPCDWAVGLVPAGEDNATAIACGAIACQPKIARLKNLGAAEGGGCWLMQRLCKTFLYEEKPRAEVLVLTDPNATVYKANRSASQPWVPESCGDECNDDISCKGYIHTTIDGSEGAPANCYLNGASRIWRVNPTAWIPMTAAAAEVEIEAAAESKSYLRTEPESIAKFQEENLRMSVVTLVLGVLITISAFVAMVLMYNVNIKRKGKHEGGSLAMMICCPCVKSPEDSDDDLETELSRS